MIGALLVEVNRRVVCPLLGHQYTLIVSRGRMRCSRCGDWWPA